MSRTEELTTLLLQLHKDGLNEGDPAYDLVLDLVEEVTGQVTCEHLEPHMKPCKTHGEDPWVCPDIMFTHVPGRGFGIPIRDGGSSFLAIAFCPFCGAKLKG